MILVYLKGERNRIFGLPKTHTISYKDPVNPEQLKFLLWCLSIFTGMRLTSEEAGFLDATPIKIGLLNDFNPCNIKFLEDALLLGHDFWEKHANDDKRLTLLIGIIHSYFLSKTPGLLCYEKFTYLYTALDACYRFTFEFLPNQAKSERSQGKAADINHAKRIEWTCRHFGIPVPTWAKQQQDKKTGRKFSLVSAIRNPLAHEGLFFGEILGYAATGGQYDLPEWHGVPLQMNNLILRFIVALLGKHDLSYVHSPIDKADTIGLDFYDLHKPDQGHGNQATICQ